MKSIVTGRLGNSFRGKSAGWLALLCLQTTALAENGLFPKSTAQATPSGLGALREWFLDSTLMFGAYVPNLLLLGAAYLCAYILVMSVVILIFALCRRDKGSGHSEQDTMVRQGAECVSYVDFQIIYQGQVRQMRANVRGNYTIGRAGCMLNLDKSDDLVSKKHCQLYFLNGVLMLKDTSQSGTLVNARRILKSGIELRSGDQIQIGQHMLIVRY